MTDDSVAAGRPGSHPGSGLRVDSLTVRYGRRTVLTDLTWQADGGVVALVGPNGSGKSTLLRVLATLHRAHAGGVRVCGHDVRSPSGATAARQALGYLPQEPTALTRLRVREAVEYAAWLKRVPRVCRADMVTAALVDLDLTHRADDRIGALSGGTRQRAHIAQAIVHRPAVLLLDEPTTGVDAEHRVELRRTLRRLAQGRLVVLSTHLTEDIELLADRVTALDAGRVHFDGTPEQLAQVGRAGDDAQPDAEPARAIEQGLRSLGTR